VGGDGVPDEHGNMVFLPFADEPKTIQLFANASLDKWKKLT
jgi:hypothetical protein